MKALGIVNVNGEEKILYIQNRSDEGNQRYVYYLNYQEIGGYDPDVSGQKIIFKENSKENELSAEIKDKVIEIIEKNVEIEEVNKIPKDYEQYKVDGLHKLLNLEDEEITRIAELDLNQELEPKDIDEKSKDELENLKEGNDENKSEKQEEHKSKEDDEWKSIEQDDKKIVYSTTKNVDIKQELEFRDKVTDMKTLGDLIESAGKMPQLDGKSFVKMGVIESSQLKNVKNKNDEFSNVNTTRYSFVAIATDGTIVPMDLEQDHQEGINSNEKNYQVMQNGNVREGTVLSRFKIGEGSFSIRNGNYGELEVFHSPRKTISGGTHSLDRQLETNNVWEMKKEERDLASEHGDGYRSVEDGYKEVEEAERGNENKDCDKIEIADIDGEEDTKGHNHDEEIVERIVKELMDNGEITDVFTEREIKEMARKGFENGKDIGIEKDKLEEKIKNDIKKDAEMLDRERDFSN